MIGFIYILGCVGCVGCVLRFYEQVVCHFQNTKNKYESSSL